MNAIDQAIQDAAAHGYAHRASRSFSHQLAFVSPSFWKSLGRARGWLPDVWRGHWHRFIDHLADGNDAESFFRDLNKNQEPAN
jgi:hypothetical protein